MMSRALPPFYDELKYKCLFGVHIEQMVVAVCTIGVTLSVCFAIAAFFVDHTAMGIFVFNACLHMTVLYAHHKQNSLIYIPYLLIEGLILFGLILLLMVCCAFLIHAASTADAERTKKVTIQELIVLVCALSSYFVLNLWFYSFLWRACSFLRRETFWRKQLNQETTTPSISMISGSSQNEEPSARADDWPV